MAVFPGAAVGYGPAGLQRHNNLGKSTLTAGVTAGALSGSVASASAQTPWPAGDFVVRIENELLYVTSRAGTALTWTRGYGGTIAASHPNGAEVRVVAAAGFYQVLAEELIAVEDWLIPSHPNAEFSLDSDSKGFLLNRVATANRNALAGPDGLTLYHVDRGRVETYTAGAWRTIGAWNDDGAEVTLHNSALRVVVGGSGGSYKFGVVADTGGAYGASIRNVSAASGAVTEVALFNDLGVDRFALGLNGSAHLTAPNAGHLWHYASAPILFGTAGQERGRLDASGNWVLGANLGLATSATAGFTWLNRMVGTPTGVPSPAYGSMVPFVFDTSAHLLWVYSGSAWRRINEVKGSGSVGRIPKWTATDTLGNSLLLESGGNTITMNAGIPAFILIDTGGNPPELRLAAGSGHGLLGMSSNHPLRIQTNGAVRAEFAADGSGFGLKPAGGVPQELRFDDADSSAYVALRAASIIGASLAFVLPAIHGSAGQALITDGTGVLSFATRVSGSGTTGTIPKFTASTTLGDSIARESGSNFVVEASGPVFRALHTGGAEAVLAASASGGWVGTTTAHPFAIRYADVDRITIRAGDVVIDKSGGPSDVILRDLTNGVDLFLRAGTASGIVGTSTAHAFLLMSGGVERGRFTAGGEALELRGEPNTTSIELRFYDSDRSHYVGFRSAQVVAASVMWVLPSADGANGQVLKTNGGGVLSWGTAGIQGSGTVNRIPRWSASDTLADSIARESGSIFEVVASGAVIKARHSGGAEAVLVATASVGYAGTVTSHQFTLRTADADRVWVTAAGLVGVGGDPGGYQFSVLRNANDSAVMAVRNSDAGASASAQILFLNNEAGAGFGIGFNSSAHAFARAGFIWHYENQMVRFGTNDTERGRIAANGVWTLGVTGGFRAVMDPVVETFRVGAASPAGDRFEFTGSGALTLSRQHASGFAVIKLQNLSNGETRLLATNHGTGPGEAAATLELSTGAGVRPILTAAGSFIVAPDGNLAQGATDGFLGIPRITGPPSGTPSTVATRTYSAMAFDSPLLWVHSGSEWVPVSPAPFDAAVRRPRVSEWVSIYNSPLPISGGSGAGFQGNAGVTLHASNLTTPGNYPAGTTLEQNVVHVVQVANVAGVTSWTIAVNTFIEFYGANHGTRPNKVFLRYTRESDGTSQEIELFSFSVTARIRWEFKWTIVGSSATAGSNVVDLVVKHNGTQVAAPNGLRIGGGSMLLNSGGPTNDSTTPRVDVQTFVNQKLTVPP